MVYVVDLEKGERADDAFQPKESIHIATDAERPYENTESRFFAILACYPVLASLATCLDLNSLDSLSKTCRLARYSLIPYKRTLSRRSLRCHNSDPRPPKCAPIESPANVADIMDEMAIYDLIDSDLPGSRRSRCATDLVRPCRNCSTIICRNCVCVKPSPYMYLGRLRRLCKICAEAPLMAFTHPTFWDPINSLQTETHQMKRIQAISTSNAFARGVCECAENLQVCEDCREKSSRSDAAYKGLWRWRRRYEDRLSGIGIGVGEGIEGVQCAMEDRCLGVKFIEVEVECNDAAPSLHYGQTHAPTPTRPAWSRVLEDREDRPVASSHNGYNIRTTMGYSPPITLGSFSPTSPVLQHHLSHPSDPYRRPSFNGPQHSYPFRDEYARAQNPTPPPDGHAPNGDSNSHSNSHETGLFEALQDALQQTAKPEKSDPKYPSRSGYFSQEVEGIGGIMQRKCKRIQRVANTVPQYADEKEGGRVLGREHRAERRSWCAWCDRVVPARHEARMLKR